MSKKTNDILPATEINTAVLADRAARKAGELSSLCNPAEISREVIASIARHVDPDRIGRVLDAMLGAKRTLKDGTELDDTRTQEAALKLYIAYTVGMPVQRSESVTVALDADSAIGLQDRLRNSPHLRESMRKMIERAEDVPKQG